MFFGFDLGEKITSSKFDIKEYIVVKVSGYDRAGCLEAEFDIDQFIDDITNGKGFPDTENAKENNNIWSDEYWKEEDSFEEKVRDNFDVSVDKASGLANGDKATITIDVYDEKLLKDYGVGTLKSKYTKVIEIGKHNVRLFIFDYI